MHSLVASAVAVVLLVLAYVHVYWGLGGAWPARTRSELGPMVVGARASAAMPDLRVCVVVAGLLVTAAGLVVWCGVSAEPPWFVRVGAGGVAAVLAVRGLGGYADGRLRPASRELPFYALNRRIYSPLCLLLAGSIAVVVAR